MPTLYVENVPKDRYEALRARARKNRSSIASEVIELLEQFVPTPGELRRRKSAFAALTLRSHLVEEVSAAEHVAHDQPTPSGGGRKNVRGLNREPHEH